MTTKQTKRQDAAEKLGRDLAKLYAAEKEADSLGVEYSYEGLIASRLSTRHDELEVLIGHQEDALSLTPSATVAGAMAQLCVAIADINSLIPDVANSEHGPEYCARAARLVGFALAALEKASGIDRSEFAGNRYAPRRLDPLRYATMPVADLIAEGQQFARLIGGAS